MMKLYPKHMQIDEVSRENVVVIFEFGGDYCSACSAINIKLQNYILNNDRVSGYYIPIEQYPDIAAGASIFSAPAVLVYVEGQLTIKEVGCFSLEDIYKRVERYLALLEK